VIGRLDMLGSEVIKTSIKYSTHCATIVEGLTGVSEQIAGIVSLPPTGGVVKSHALELLGLLMYSVCVKKRKKKKKNT
jgi:hypothetical protein